MFLQTPQVHFQNGVKSGQNTRYSAKGRKVPFPSVQMLFCAFLSR
jgi:hypothetical protein